MIERRHRGRPAASWCSPAGTSAGPSGCPPSAASCSRSAGSTGASRDVYLPLFGAHQAANAAAALASPSKRFLGFAGGIDPDVIREGFAAVRSPGRLRGRARGRRTSRTVVLDGAHNPAGAASLASDAGRRVRVPPPRDRPGRPGGQGRRGDGRRARARVADHVVATRRRRRGPLRPSASPTPCAPTGVPVEIAADVADALERARGVGRRHRRVVVTGSLTTVGAARTALGLPPALRLGCRPMSERTLVLVKPDGVQRGLVGEVVARFERKGLTLARLELRTITRDTAGRALRRAREQGLLRRPRRRSSPPARWSRWSSRAPTR